MTATRFFLCGVIWLAVVACGCAPATATTPTADRAPSLVPGARAGDPPTADADRSSDPAGQPAIDDRQAAGLAELRTRAVEQFPLPAVAGRAPEAAAVIEATFAARRLAWVVDQLKPPPLPAVPPTPPTLNLGDLHVGDAGVVDAMCTVDRVENDTLVLRPPGPEDHPLFAATGVETAGLATGHKVRLNGYYEAYTTGKFGPSTLVVIRAAARPAAPGPPRDVHREAMFAAAAAEHRKALAVLDTAQAAYARAFEAVKAKAEADAKAEAKRLVPQPDEDPTLHPTNDEISQARAKLASTERRLLKEAMEKMEKVWGVPADYRAG